MKKRKPCAVFMAAIAAFVVAAACSQPAGGTPVPVITITGQPKASTEVREGTITGSLSVAATVTENAILGYQWYSNTTASNEGGTVVAGATTASYTIPTNLAVGEYYYFCEITASGDAASKRSTVATVRVVLNTGTPFITITIQPQANTEVMEGSIAEGLYVAADGIGGALVNGYQWYSTITASTEGGTLVPGAVMPSFSIPANLAEGEYYYFCEIAASVGAASVRSNVATVTVRPRPVVTITSQPEEDTAVKVGLQTGSLSVTATVPGDVVLAYPWYENTSASNEGGYPLSGATSSGFTLPYYWEPGEYFYYCEIWDPGFVVESVYSNVAKVTVSNPDIDFVINVTELDEPELVVQTADALAGEDKVFSAAGSGWETYQWYVDGIADTSENGKLASYTFNRPADAYNLTVVVTDGAGDKYSGTCRVTVQEGA